MSKLSALETTLIVTVSVLFLVIIILLVYYYVTYEKAILLSSNSKEIFYAFKNLSSVSEQRELSRDIQSYLRDEINNLNNPSLIKNSSKNQDFYARDEGGIEPEAVDAPTETFYDDSIRER